MVLDLVITNTGDGYSGEVPSLQGCESWAHTEEETISKTVELVKFYLNIPEEEKIKIDKARRSKNKTVYKLVFNKV